MPALCELQTIGVLGDTAVGTVVSQKPLAPVANNSFGTN